MVGLIRKRTIAVVKHSTIITIDYILIVVGIIIVYVEDAIVIN